MNAGVRVEWQFADGRRETTVYRADDRFTLVDEFTTGSGYTIDPTCVGMGEPDDD